MTFAEKMMKIYNIKLNIRNTIRKMGVPVGSDIPFEEYPRKIELIQGEGGGEPQIVSDGFKVSDTLFPFEFTYPRIVKLDENVNFAASDVEITEAEFSIVYIPSQVADVMEPVKFENVSDFKIDEFLAIEFSLHGFAQNINLRNADKYNYDPDWVSFTDSGAYVVDKHITNESTQGTTTDTGVYYSLPLPDSQSYGELIDAQVFFTSRFLYK